MTNNILNKILEHMRLAEEISKDTEIVENISKSVKIIIEAYNNGNKLLLCGNGGSASDAQHLSTEFVSRFYKDRKALNAQCLNTNTSSLTAIGNDFDFNKIFSRQIEALGNSGDVLIAISTSGNSQNVIEAIKAANSLDMVTIGLTGADKNSQIFKEANLCISVPSTDTPRIQEMHIMIGHIICEYVEKQLFD